MIILTIRTDNPTAEIGLYSDLKQLGYQKWQAHRELADTIHKKIKTLLDDCSYNWHDLEGVVVFSGPGSFTGLRIGITVANTLIYGLKINGVGSSGEDWINDGVNRVIASQSDKIVKPEYGAEAHITKPKH